QSINESTIMSSVWRLLIKKELIVDNSIIFPQKINRMQDLAFSLEVFIHTEKVCVVKDCLYHYKVHDDSASMVYDVNRFEKLIKILPIIEDILIENKIENYKKRLNNRYLFIAMKSISNEAKDDNPNTFKVSLNNIKIICEHPSVQSAVNNMN